MAENKKSFFERLAGTVLTEDLDNNEEENELDIEWSSRNNILNERDSSRQNNNDFEQLDEGELSVDVYQTQNEIIIEAMLAGVKPEDLHISITRDLVTIKGRRDGNTQISPDDYFYRELYWGSFSRSILLPSEIDIDSVEAVEKHGLLIVRLPKLDKTKQSRVVVRSI